MFNRKTWIEGEVIARDYLISLGYKIIEQNVKISGSEIDIVAKLPIKVQKKKLIKEYKENAKINKNSDKSDKKFAKIILKNNLSQLKEIIVFVEVKARFSKKFGYPFEAVDEEKQYNLSRGCVSYLKKNNLINLPARIDVISVIDGDVVHIENAFDVVQY